MIQGRVLTLSLVALAVVVLLVVGYFQDPFGWRQAAKDRAVTAEQGQALAEQTTGIVERTVRTEVIVRQEAERQVDAIQKAPGASDVLDPGFRDQLKHGIGVMRGEAKASDDQRASGPERTLP